METDRVQQTAEALYETARRGRLGLEAIRRAEAGDEGDGTPVMMRTIGGFTYVLETGGKLWVMEADRGEGAGYQEPVKVSPQETARLFRFMPIALEQLLDYGREYDKAREAKPAE